jgi:hypothetical protein
MKKKTKKKNRIKAKVRTKTELAALIMELQAVNKTLSDRLTVAEAQIANLLAQVIPDKKHWPNWPYVNPWSPSWSPNWPTYYAVRTEVQRDPAV